MTTIAQPSAHTAATGHAPAVTWYNDSASATAAPPAAPATGILLMGPPGHGATAQLMGPTACAVRENRREKARGSSLVTGYGRRAGWREAVLRRVCPLLRRRKPGHDRCALPAGAV